MQIAMIACMAKNRVIGKDNQMPWHLPADLAHFKKVTMGKPIVMGRKTYDSIGRPLPGRRNIVISRQQGLKIEGVDVVTSIDEALALAKNEADELMIIGGGQLYQALLPRAEQLYLTIVDAELEGDTYFPEWQSQSWQQVSSELRPADERNAHALNFVHYQRR